MAVNRNRHAAAFLRMLAEKEVRLRKIARGVFWSQAHHVARAFENGSTIDAIEMAKSFEARWYKSLVAHYTITEVAFRKYTNEQIGAEVQRGEARTYREIILDFIRSEGLAKAKDINATTTRSIKKILEQGVKEGLGAKEIARNIRKQIGQVQSLDRAITIARTETHNAATFTGQKVAEASGIDLDKEWVTNLNDDRAREHHVDADGQTVSLKEKFYVGGDFIDRPGEGSAKNAIKCRCSVIFKPKKAA